MNIIGIIPSRFASTRFPGKPLVDIGGKSMLQRVYEQAKKSSSLSDVYVATDDERIEAHVKSCGGKVVLTINTHQSGTDRCFEAITNISSSADVVINIQGDEPFIHPECIDLVVGCFGSTNVQIATLIKKINTVEDLLSPTIMKVIKNKNDEAIYFSRSAIPHIRGKEQTDWLNHFTFYKHIGIYAYTTKALKEITSLPQSSLELAESLEQLRWLENGFTINVAITDLESVSIDTPEDLIKLKNFL